jgi:phospholipid/cholesterol/gamma-HCH transport system substrate-binding protein
MIKISKELKIGFIVTLIIALFIWGLNFLKGKNMLTSNVILYAVYNNVGGLMESGNVSIRGLQVGKVNRIYFLPGSSDKIIVELAIKKEYKVPKNSIAKIYSIDFMGSKAIDLILSNSKELCKENDTLTTDYEESLMDQINTIILPVKYKAEKVMSSIDTVLGGFRNIMNLNTQRSIQRSFNNIENSTYLIDNLLDSEQKHISSLIVNLESISANLKDNNTQLSSAMRNFKNISDSLAASKLKSTIENTNLVLLQTKEILEKINHGKGSAGLLINDDSLYRHLDGVTIQLQQLMDDLKNHPNRYVHFSVFGKKN